MSPWKNVIEPEKPQIVICGFSGSIAHILVIRRMRFACWVTKVKHKYSEYVTLIAIHGNSVYMNASSYVYISCLAFTVYAAFGT
jgi:hypothetical protein